MIVAAQQHDLLPGTSTAAVAGLFVALLALWVGLHALSRRAARRRLRAPLLALRVAAGFGTLMAAGQLAVRAMLLTTSWRLWPIALAGSGAVEALLGLYALERRTVSRRAGLTLAGLRVTMVLLVIAMLTQPVLSWELVDEIQRYVAVLIDGSASMLVRDPQRTPGEKLRLGEMLGVGAARRPVRLEEIGRDLQALRGELVAAVEDLGTLTSTDAPARQRQLEARRADLQRSVLASHKRAETDLAALGRAADGAVKLDDATRNALRDSKAELAVGVRDRLDKARQLLDGGNASRLGADYDRLVDALRGAAGALAKLAEQVPPLAEAYDARFHASLSDEQRSEIDAATDRTRLELARDVLVSRPGGGEGTAAGKGLLDELSARYKVKLYKFAEDCVEGDVDRLRRSAGVGPASGPATQPASRAVEVTTRPVGVEGTDLARAIEKVATEMSGKQLAGVVMLLDGRHNGPRRVEPLAAQLGGQKVPLCSVVMAPDNPPRDAAVLHVRAPQNVTEQDKFLVDAELKLDGLAGQDVEVALFDESRRVAVETLHVPGTVRSYRPRVQFSDEPKGPGLHTYSVRIKPMEGEVFGANNDYPLTVSVTQERIRLLLLEDRPRWEFRYLKNIFADRDRNVKLQYVLLQPDQIAGQVHRLKVHASASRAVGQIEATLLPAGPQEWMKFDVIVLGDVPTSSFSPEQMDTLRKFVTERGGTLVVIAGPDFMPHAYEKTPLAEVLPVTFEPSDKPVEGGSQAGFRVSLTAVGREHTVMYQNVDPEENLKVWNGLPEVFWRHPTAKAKEGTTVLAYAVPPSPPEFLRPLPPGQGADEAADREREAKLRAFQQDHALITLHQVAAGRVMMLSFDRTWRLRYRVGDTYHHRFWGQVMRWATAEKLRAGTDFVRLGTDRTRYEPGRGIRVRAKIVQPDLSPVISKSVAVRVYAGDRMLLRRKLEYRQDSPGLYEAEIFGLEHGTYRIELEAPEAEPILAADKVKKVATEFSIDPVSSAEELELSADRALLRRLANLTGGVVVDPVQARDVLPALGPESLVRRERRELRLWDSWPLLVLIVLVATIEWTLRKRIGLA
ncbi:MAG TPA: hypothetical protein VM695_07285 [Phycisphaerae bacterium]|nr:hypothetical protein [Phycisphaerae bacterium]